MIYRGLTFKLEPTEAQSALFRQHAGVCRLVYNLCLEQRRDWWKRYQERTGDNLNYVTQARQLTTLRAECDFIRAVSQTAEQMAIRALDTAFKNFFAGRAGFPTPHRKGVNDGFSFAGRQIEVKRLNRNKGAVKLPKIGWVKFRGFRPAEGRIMQATISHTNLGWQVSIGCEIDRDITHLAGAVGIDRGVAVPLMLSDGTSYELPASVRLLAQKINVARRVVSRRKRGSKRQAIARARVARLCARQARIRKDWAHRATTAITRQYGTVVVESLRTKNMTKSAAGTIEAPGRNVAQKRGLNRVILNVGWHQIETMLTYKAGRIIKVNPAHTSQTCASCGTVDSRSRKNQAVFVCTACGHRDNADRNAAINILNRGNTAGVEEGHLGLSVEARTTLVKRQGNLDPSGPRRC